MALLYQSPTRYLPSGYTFRGADMYDVPSIVYLLNRRQLQNTGFRADDFRREWQTPGFNPAIDIRLVFDLREVLVGYFEVWVNHNQPWLWGCVHPDFEGRGIGSALLRWGEARVGLALAQLPSALRTAPRFSTLPGPGAHALCASFGWRQIRLHKTEIQKVTGALHLPESAQLSYDVYEKAIDLLH